MKCALRNDNVGKRYKLGLVHHDKMADAIMYGLGKLVGRKNDENYHKIRKPGIHPEGTDHIWALRNVSFEVEHGEAVGIIGQNGAGKSTLLKILTGITDPTEGRVEMRGRIASLLEVGTGFHPEFTGRENVFMNGSILGMTREQIKNKFDEIVAFAEVETFIDTPVKRYSSGMYVRLAFAVAAHLEPEILLVDEVLAVGDLAFQKKCLGKMNEVAKEGRTILFVSHNMAAISNLTTRCVYLKDGQMRMIDETAAVVKQYYNDAHERLEEENEAGRGTEAFRRGKISDTLHITAMEVNGVSGKIPTLSMHEKITITMVVQVERAIQGANATIRLKNDEGNHVVTYFTWDDNYYVELHEGVQRLSLTIDHSLFPPGRYFCDLGINQTEFTRAFDVLLDYPLFEIRNDGQVKFWANRSFGAIHQPGVTWSSEAGDPP